jgi:hypothetical protein
MTATREKPMASKAKLLFCNNKEKTQTKNYFIKYNLNRRMEGRMRTNRSGKLEDGDRNRKNRR